jgi:biotin synthase-like enzyme
VIDTKTRRLYERALTAWGVYAQAEQAQEEAAELIVALSHWKRGGKRREVKAVIEEIAGVEIMLEQLRLVAGFDEEAIQQAKDRKRARLEQHLDAWEAVERVALHSPLPIPGDLEVGI